MRPEFWLARLAISTWAMMLGMMLVFEQQSLGARMIKASGTMGSVVPLLLLGLGVIAVVDCIVNDLLPGVWLKTMYYRYIGFPAISVTLVMIAGALTVNKASSVMLMLNFIVPAAFAFALTFLEIFSRRSVCK